MADRMLCASETDALALHPFEQHIDQVLHPFDLIGRFRFSEG